MTAIAETRKRARAAWRAGRDDWRTLAASTLDESQAERFVARVDRSYEDAFDPLEQVYGGHSDVPAMLDGLLRTVLAAVAARPADLRHLDAYREINPDWFLDETMVGYVCYADRFAGDLAGVAKHVDYLRELGVTYLHLMPLLAAREGPNDGGYAVTNYRRVDPRLGDMDDLRRLTSALRAEGISLCVDLVINHTAREHEWAQKAAAGEQRYRDYYLIFGDRELPDAFERHLPEIFPDRAPGNFTWVDDLQGWVWTTFHDYQWDLDYANPAVFVEMLEVMLNLANVGVDVFRLDAAPFIWKRLGTNCQNQREAHFLLQAFRALLRIAAPATLFKAEAIVPPDELVQYLGAHDLHRRECDLAYHNQLMVMLWSGVASRDARLPTHALSRMRAPAPDTTWLTYVRNHDDIGWAISDIDAAAAELDAFAHKWFLIDFYSGNHPGTFASGERFGFDPFRHDARTSGSAASLAGVEQALARGDERLLEAAISRLLLLHAVIYGWGGIPLLYMGDELALRNDHSYAGHLEQIEDNRWMHRPAMDWPTADRRSVPGTLEHQVFSRFRDLAEARAAAPPLHGDGVTVPVWTGNDRVLAWLRRHPRFGVLLGLANFDDRHQVIDVEVCLRSGLPQPHDVLRLWPIEVRDGGVRLPALSVAWISSG